MIRRQPLNERRRRILRAVVHEHIRTAEPVASETLARRYRLRVSSATVRNELAELERLGLVDQPHTSAGRVPTDRGYRYFIESLMDEPTLGLAEQMTLRHQFHQVQLETSEWLRLAASVLARLSTGAALVTMPHAARSRLKHLEVVPIQGRRALLVVVLDGGVVRQQLLELPSVETPLDLRKLSSRLTDELAQEDAIGVRAKAPKESGEARVVLEAVARTLEELDGIRALEVYYDGVRNLLQQPEFASSLLVGDALAVLEDRTRLARLLPPALGPGEVSVYIGGENPLEVLRRFSVVFGRYGSHAGSIHGFMGVVGPTRMDYARSIGAVRYVGALMSELMSAVDV